MFDLNLNAKKQDCLLDGFIHAVFNPLHKSSNVTWLTFIMGLKRMS